MSTGVWVFVILFTIFWFALFISGIVYAAKSQDTKYEIWKVILHLIIWGGFIALIVYLVKVSNNKALPTANKTIETGDEDDLEAPEKNQNK